MGRVCALCNRKSGVSFHGFPKNPELAKKWKEACGYVERDVVDTLKICSRHFQPDDFQSYTRCDKKTGQTSMIYSLKPKAIPFFKANCSTSKKRKVEEVLSIEVENVDIKEEKEDNSEEEKPKVSSDKTPNSQTCDLDKIKLNSKSFKCCIVCDAVRTKDTELHLFRFPKNPYIKDKWIDFCIACGVMEERDRTFNCRPIRLCSLHFRERDLRGNLRFTLVRFALPRIIKPGVYYVYPYTLEEARKLIDACEAQAKNPVKIVLDGSGQFIEDIVDLNHENCVETPTDEPLLEPKDSLLVRVKDFAKESHGSDDNGKQSTLPGNQPAISNESTIGPQAVPKLDLSRIRISSFTDVELQNPDRARLLKAVALKKARVHRKSMNILQQKFRRLQKRMTKLMPFVKILKKNKMLPNCLAELEVTADNPLVINTSYVNVDLTDGDLTDEDLYKETIEIELVDEVVY